MGRGVLLIAAILLAVTGRPAVAAPVASPGPTSHQADRIWIVPQNQGADWVDPDVAAWSPDDRFILTMASAGSGEVLLRDATTGEVVNRLGLPPDADGDLIMVNTLTFGATNAAATATAFATHGGPHPRCRWLTYAIDLAGGTVAMKTTTRGAGECSPIVPLAARLNGLLAHAHRGPRNLVDMLPDGSGSGTGLYITDDAGNLVQSLQQPKGSLPTLGLRDAAMAADGRTMALIVDPNGAVPATVAADQAVTNGEVEDRPIQHSTVVLFDSTLRQFGKTLTLTGRYTRVRWIDAGHILLTRDYIADERAVSANMHHDRSLLEPPPALVVEAASGTVTASLAMTCYLAPVPGGRFIGAGLANCLGQFDDAPRGLVQFVPGQGWQPFAPGIEGNGHIDALAVSPDGTRLVMLLRAGFDGDRWTLLAIDRASGTVTARQTLADAGFAGLTFDQSGRGVIIQTPMRRQLWRPDSGNPPADLAPADTINGGAWPDVIVADRGVIIDVPPGDTIARIDRTSLARLPDLRFASVIAAGFVPGKPQFWAASASDGVRMWDTRNWAPMQTVMLFADQHSLAYMQDGRYDTDLGPDSNTFRWRVADQPERVLGPQTFMRAYYTPRLLERLEQCIAVSGGCAAAFPRLPAPVDLNRTLPLVTIDKVEPGATAATAQIEVTVAEGRDAAAPNAKTRSGLFDLRLFRNGSLIAEYPDGPAVAADATTTQWQAANAMTPAPDGKVHHRFVVPLPTGPGNARNAFSAYAFNSDRIKSDTATANFAAAPTAAQGRRAFVLAIGIDGYVQPRLKLSYAVNDAMLMARRLGTLPGQPVHTLALANGQASKAKILAAIDLLAGGNRRADLATLGLADSDFVQTTPDDLVIITFSGHGWADPRGNFYLLPTDADWPDSAELPDRSSLLSSAEIADALKRVDAGEMALVIDACHSAASVDTVWFKPGPMGDPGLGQLAFDKGIRILAAAGRDDVAREDRSIRQGLLTYVLADQAIDDGGFGRADLNCDGRIMLDEWLRYALVQLPVLSQQAAPQSAGHRLGGFTVIADSQALQPRPQVPALFDFNHQVSTEALREAARAPCP